MPDSANSNYQGKENQGNFGRELMKYVSSRLPYTSLNVADKINQLNPKY